MRRLRLVSALLGGVLVGVVVPARSAEALDCREPRCEYPEPLVWPRKGAIGVPTNTRIWLDEAPSELTLEGPGGTVEVVRSDVLYTTVFTPVTELAPMTTYTARWSFYGAYERSFTTGAGPDTKPPAIPRVLGREIVRDREGGFPCNYRYHYADYEVSSESDSIVLLDLGGEAMLDAEAVGGWVSVVAASLSGGSVHFVLGDAPCPDYWRDAERGDETTVRFAAYDFAGNFSGWSEVETVELSGCRAASGGPLALVVLAFVRRRRATSRRS